MKIALSESVPDSKFRLGLAERYESFIFVSFQSFNKRNLERFGATWVLDYGKSVLLVDLSWLVWGGTSLATGGPSEDENVLCPQSWEEFAKIMTAQTKPALIVLCAVIPQLGAPLFGILARQDKPILYFQQAVLPQAGNYINRLKGLAEMALWHPLLLFGKAFQRVKSLWSEKVYIEYLLLGSRACEMKLPSWIKGAGQKIPCHSYDFVVWDTSPAYSCGKPYIVFLDQACPDHNDPIRLKLANPFKKEIYYPEMGRFLKHVSAKYGMPVLVALHPRALGGNPYEGLQALTGHTASLVKGASLVIAHDTAAISFAVLSRKPMVLVKLNEMQQWTAGGIIDRLAAALGTPVLVLKDSALPPIEKLVVNDSKYQFYEEMYLRHPFCNGAHVWERVFAARADKA